MNNKSEDWCDGWNEGVCVAQYEAAIEAFAAIRRSAEVARECDKWAGKANYHGFTDDVPLHKAQGMRVRQAIRAAIGSTKI